MEQDLQQYWQDRWRESPTPFFHIPQVQPTLIQQFAVIGTGARVLVPLCGKTLDIGFLLQQQCQVVGIELSRIAVEQLFAQLQRDFGADLGAVAITEHGAHTVFQANNIRVICGDIFTVTPDLVTDITRIYDRAALVALPAHLRAAYTAKLRELSHTAAQLLLSFDYDQNLVAGPPFALALGQVAELYQDFYDIQQCADKPLPQPIKGVAPAKLCAFVLTPKSV